MYASGPEQPGVEFLLQNIAKDFDALVREFEHALAELTADAPEASDIERLRRAKAAAEKGAALARSKLLPD